MDTLIHADIFFFVTTIAIIIIAAVFTIALIYLVKILSDVKKITGEVHEETMLFREDIGNLRNDIKREGFKLTRFLSFVSSFFGGLGKRHKTTRSKNK